MKKILYLTMIVAVLLSLSASSVVVFAQEGGPGPDLPDDLPKIYLPLITVSRASYTLAGQIKDSRDLPVSGVAVSAEIGGQAVTNAGGFYNFTVSDGNHEVQASKEGLDFEPSTANLEVNGDMYNLNFTAVAACDTPVANPSFEIVPYYWNPISGNANGYTPYYSTAKANTGVRSGATGILPGESNLVSWSRWRTHEIYIAAGSTSADVTMFYWPQTGETPALPETKMPSKLLGVDTESPNVPTIVNDWQYVSVINATTNAIIHTFLWTRKNDQAWVALGPYSLLPWSGQTVKLEFGVYNDGAGGALGVTSAWWDDVNLEVCPGGSPGVGCSNYLLNSTFEGATNWVIKAATNPSAYTTEYSYSPTRSMISGVSKNIANPFPGIWTTGEFYQPVTIPADAYYARIRARLLPRSSQWNWWKAQSEPPKEIDRSYDPEALAAAEAQYGFIMDTTGLIDQRMLFKWFAYDSAYWLYREFDVLDFRGQAISVLFGAANDGFNGNTGLYVDDAVLEVCR